MQFSIIIPIHNTKEFLCKCLDSIVSQTFYDFEIILIDDGSSDGSEKICDKYADIHNNITVYHIPDSGVSKARNIGIKHAQGEWIAFIDSDDYVEKNWLEVVSMTIKKYKAELYIWGNYLENNNYQKEFTPQHINTTSSTDFILSGIYRHNAWLYLFSNERIKKYNCEFPEGIKRSEDQCFLLQYLSHNPTILPICQPFYHYVRHTDSVTCSPYTIDDVGDNLRVATIFAEYAKKYENIDKNFIFYSTTQLFHDFLNYAKDIDELFDSYTQTVFRKYYDEIVHLFPEFTKDTPLKRAYKSIKSAYCRDRITNMLQNYTIGCTILNIWHKIHL